VSFRFGRFLKPVDCVGESISAHLLLKAAERFVRRQETESFSIGFKALGGGGSKLFKRSMSLLWKPARRKIRCSPFGWWLEFRPQL
jgi:hypothetical protein